MGDLRPIACVTSIALVLSLGLTAAAGTRRQTGLSAVPTFNKDVAPVLFTHCVTCHRPGEIAPMSLVSYDDARPWARAIRRKVVAREMPPWPADLRYGRFRNQHTLSEAEIATLASWADGDAPRGVGMAPRPPRFRDGWTDLMDRPPDLVIDAPLAFDVPAQGEVPVFTIWQTLPFRDERYVEAIELRPTNRALVHHAAVFAGDLPREWRLTRTGAWANGPIVDGIPVLRDGTRAVRTDAVGTPLVFYVPGGGILRLRDGIAKRLRGADQHLVWTFHLVPSGTAERAGARLGIWFRRGNVHHEAVTRTITDTIAVNGTEIPRGETGPMFPVIAPHQQDYAVTGLMRVAEDITVHALWPHMHFRGRSMTFSVLGRESGENVLLSVPKYDYNWQFTYELERPLRIRAGSTLKVIARYDNSSANPFNPDPTAPVIWGDQATNEMFNPFIEVTYDRRELRQPLPFDCGLGSPGGINQPCR